MSRLLSLGHWIAFICLIVLNPAHAEGVGQPMFPAEWFARPLTPQRVQDVQAAVATGGWKPVAAGLYVGVIGAYQRGQIDAATSWYYLASWCNLLGDSQRSAGQRWLETESKAGLLNARAPQAEIRALTNEPLAKLLTPETLAWLLGDRVFSESFFRQLSTYDYLPRVLTILQELRTADLRRFTAYNQLALAIALVYDAPPPDEWPHYQVTAEALPRHLPEPLAAFNFLVEADGRGATLQKLATLPVSELKFAVDLAASFPELKWAQKTVKFPLVDLAKVYEAVRYQNERINDQQFVWPGKTYELEDIYKEGGICVDQAYFATQVGKAKGVPTLLFAGAGLDGRHAWFGYLGANQKWMLDAGRYADQRFVTGVAIDPQTWTLMSDHELKFLAEGFRKFPAYQQSREHELFAELFLHLGEKQLAMTAARKAVGFERRNFEAWETLLAASEDADVKTRETILREAANAFQRYPDLNNFFVRKAVSSLRARGETSAADFEERAIVRKNQGGRSDLGIDQAAATISRVLEKSALPEQLKVYRQVLQQYGPGAGMDFYDRVVVPFVAALSAQGKKTEATTVLAQTRKTLKPDADSQLDREMKRLEETLK